MFSEERVLYEFEEDFCRRFTPVLRDFGCQELHQVKRDGTGTDLSHWWRLRDSHESERRTDVAFDEFAYVDSDREFGDVQVFEQPAETDQGYRRDIQAPPEGIKELRLVHVSVAKRSEHSDYRASVNFSITDKKKVTAKGGVDGIAEADATSETTTTLSTSFGKSGGNSFEREIRVSDELHLEIPGNAHRVATFDVARVKEVRPWTEKAYIDCGGRVDCYHWMGKHSHYLTQKSRHQHILHWSNIQDLRWLLEGDRRAEYPGMVGFLDKCSPGSLSFYNWLKDRENRRVELEGQTVRSYPSGGSLIVREA